MGKALAGKHIFVVEDNAANLAIISSILRRSGASISYDRWGHDTITKMLKLEHVDIILLDLMFPSGITGYDIFDKLQETPELADIPVVIVSAADPTTEMHKARSKGFQGFISKPVDYLTFPQILETILEGTPVWGDLII